MIFYEYKNHWSDDGQAWPVVLKTGVGGEKLCERMAEVCMGERAQDVVSFRSYVSCRDTAPLGCATCNEMFNTSYILIHRAIILLIVVGPLLAICTVLVVSFLNKHIMSVNRLSKVH